MRHASNGGHWLFRLMLLAIVAAIALLVWLLPAFHLKKIEISPLVELNGQEILDACGLDKGQHLFSGLGGSLQQILQLRYPAAEEQLARKFPSIRKITASMDFPGKIDLVIDERLQVAYLSIHDGCVMIDKDGVALKIWPDPPVGIPVIEGITATSLILGQPLGVDAPSALNSAISLMGAIIDADKDTRAVTQLLPNISKIRPVGGRRIYLTLILPVNGEVFQVEAETGEDMQEDMLWLRFALSQGAFDSLGKGMLDLTGSRKTFTPDT
jgi:hypothetical protein